MWGTCGWFSTCGAPVGGFSTCGAPVGGFSTCGAPVGGFSTCGAPVGGVNTSGKGEVGCRNRPDIRLNPVPAGYPASRSGSGSGPVSKSFAGFLPDFSSEKCISKILKCIVFVQF